MKHYNFDEIVPREGTNCMKYDARAWIFKREDVLPLWVADMDFRTPHFIVDALRKRAAHEIFGYTFRPDSFYASIEGWMKRRHGWNIRREWISFSPGVVAGLSFALEAFSAPGDGVIVQPPVYFPFFEVVKKKHRKVIENPLQLVNGRYTFDFEDLKKKAEGNAKILLLCNPQNPGGMVWTRGELEQLMDVCRENGILVVSDEIHSDLVFNGYRHIPVASLSRKAAGNSVVLMAPSKTFNVAGLASSVVIIPDKQKFLRYEEVLQAGHLGMGNIFGSVALEAAYSQGDQWLDQLMDYLWENYLFLARFFEKHLPKVRVMQPEATFLVWLDFSQYGMDDKALFRFTVEKARVGLNNGDRFGTGGSGWLRLNFGCPRPVLEEALLRLKNAFDSL